MVYNYSRTTNISHTVNENDDLTQLAFTNITLHKNYVMHEEMMTTGIISMSAFT